MTPYSPYGLKIVRSYAGSGTAETIYVTEDGAHWTNDPAKMPSADSTVSPRTGRVVGNVMITGARWP